MRKTYFDGTHRIRSVEATWETIRPLLPEFGITRVADVTGLDDIGIPVAQAVRPLARTLSVAQGKGTTLTAAQVSSAMEAIEVWHGEHAVPRSELRAPAEHLDLPYPVTALEVHPGSLVTPRTLLDWIPARSLTDRQQVPVPVTSVQLGRQVHSTWRLHLPSSSTNGLASGNSHAEAVCHGLYELIERDVISDLTHAGHRAVDAQRINPFSIHDLHVPQLLERLDHARLWYEVWSLPNRFGVPVMACYLWREDQPTVVVSGSGAHLDPHIALSRAITEAVQTRLTLITGAREDIAPAAFCPGTHPAPSHGQQATVPWSTVTEPYTCAFEDVDEEAAHLAALIAARTGTAPLVVDLTRCDFGRPEFSVVKTIAPHLRYDARHIIPRPRTGTTDTGVAA